MANQDNLIRRISIQSTSLFMGKLFENIIFFLLTIYLARSLGVGEFGVFRYATSLTGFFFMAADLGLSMLIVREIARLDSGSRQSFLGVSLTLKLILSVIVFVILLLTIAILRDIPEVKTALFIFGLSILVSSLSAFYCGIFQGYERIGLIPVVRIFGSILTCILGVFAIHLKLGVIGVGVGYVIGNLLSLILAFFFKRKVSGHFKLQYDSGQIKNLLHLTIPFGVLCIFSLLYFQIDSVMIYKMIGKEAVGIYGAAMRIIVAVCFFTEAFMGTIYPILSRYAKTDREQLNKIYRYAIWFLYIVGLPSTLGMIIISKPLVIFLFKSDYAMAGDVLAILSPIIFVRFISNVPEVFLTAVDLQIKRMWMMIIASFASIFFNLIFIPRYGYFGSAYVNLAINTFLLIIFFYIASRAGGKLTGLFQRLVRPTIASVLMAVCLLLVKNYNVILQILIGIISYTVFLFGLRAFSSEEKGIIKEALKGFGVNLK